MNKIFCQHCGTKHDYASVKPKFCSSCGEGFPGTVVASKKRVEVDYEDDEEEESEVDFDNLPKVKISVGSATMTFGDVYGVGTPDKTRRPSRFTPESARESAKSAAANRENSNPIEISG